MAYLIGQFLGLLVPIFTITIAFWKKKWQILVCAIAANALMVANLLLIGQFGSAVLLCAVAVVQSVISLVHNCRNTPITKAENVLFFVLYVGLGFVGMFTAPGFVFGINTANLIDHLFKGRKINCKCAIYHDTEVQRKGMLQQLDTAPGVGRI